MSEAEVRDPPVRDLTPADGSPEDHHHPYHDTKRSVIRSAQTEESPIPWYRGGDLNCRKLKKLQTGDLARC